MGVPEPATAPAAEETSRPWCRRWAAVILGLAGATATLVICLLVGLVRGRGQEPWHIDTTSARVDLGYATYVGTRLLDSNVDQYLGIPYAAPPVGNLRWRAPVDPEDKGDVVEAHEFKPICLGISAPYPNDAQDEDCLYANVWTPSNATPESKLPVWLFIQGGGYTSLSNANWNGSDVVARSGGNIVMAEFNYRVGLWGFLASDKVRADGDLNVGLLDQRMMLAWVQKHISKFGGDPARVVIHGASAGAGSAVMHLTAYGGRDDHLFAGAIGESVFFPAQPYLPELEWQFDKVVELVGCGDRPDRDTMNCLRGIDTETLQTANAAQPFPGTGGNVVPTFYWTPCIDGDMLEDLPYRMLEKGRFVQVPIIFGNDQDEGTIFAADASDEQGFRSFMQGNFPNLTDADTDAILARYPLEAPLPSHAAYFPSLARAYGEATFTCPGIHVLASYRNHSNRTTAPGHNNTINATTANRTSSDGQQQHEPPIWSYRYNVRDSIYTSQGLGVVHLSDAAAVFGPDNIPGPGAAPPGYYTYNAGIVPIVMDYYISFVRALDPNAYRNGDAPEWERWGAGDGGGGRRVLLETNSSRMETAPREQLDRCEFWRGLAGHMRS